MNFIPEEFLHILYTKMNYFESKLSNCTYQEFEEMFKLYYLLAFYNIDFNHTYRFGNKLLHSAVNCAEKEKVDKMKKFIETNLKLQEKNIERNSRRILN